jgi:histidinol-phosphate aminotransferase
LFGFVALANAVEPALAGWCVSAAWRRRADIEQAKVRDRAASVQPRRFEPRAGAIIFAMPLEFAERIRRIPAYPVAGGYALPDDIALLASNESPDPPLPAVIEAINRTLTGLNRYPDPSNSGLRHALSDRYGVPANRIAIGNGSCDILLALGEALLEPGAEIVYGWPSFSVYPHLSAASGARAIPVPLDAEDRHDFAAMTTEITAATRMVIVCNPNNPTSTALPLADIADFVARVPRHVAVILDEAYIEFSLVEDPDASLALLDKHPNLVLLRTFSKIYGLAGLRVGFALCGSEEFVQAVNQVRQPFFCNVAAQAAAIEALKHQDAVAERVERAVVARVTLQDGLERLGVKVAEGQANFAWMHLPDATAEQAVIEGLRERGVLVRSGTALGREGALRVTYGTPHENERFLAAMAEILG